jgi:hypothetical protein
MRLKTKITTNTHISIWEYLLIKPPLVFSFSVAEPLVQHHLVTSVRDVRIHGGQPLQGRKYLLALSQE